jgi:hypothetical protein
VSATPDPSRPTDLPTDEPAAATGADADSGADGRTPKQHGDPLLDSAQGRGDGSDASRHGVEPAPEDGPA